jgi:DNA repair protein RadD
LCKRRVQIQELDVLILRPYQAAAVAALRASYASGHRAPLLQLPTGGGKTVIFSEIACSARAKNKRVLVVVHRRELLRQAAEKLAWAGVPHGVIAAGFEVAPAEQVQVASIQTVARRLDSLPAFDLMVVDEAHHCRAEQWRALRVAQPRAKLLGVTATPARLDGKGLGISAGGCFDDLVCGPSVAELVRGGYLSPIRCFVPAQRLNLSGVRSRAGDYVAADLEPLVDACAVVGDAVDQYRRRADHQAAIAFCVSVKHAEHVAENFREAGYRSACVHGRMPVAERDRLIGGLGTGAIEILSSCDLISEGLDVPAVAALILLRPTKSLPLFMQQVGRGMRPAPGKAALVVLDHAGNSLAHGLPDVDRIWSLDGVSKSGEPPVWTCPECGCVNSLAIRVCQECDYERPLPEPKPRHISHAPGELAELTAEKIARARRLSYRQILRLRLSEAELHAFTRAHGYKRGWVQHRLREQARASAA